MKELEDVLKKDPESKGLVKQLRDAKDKKWLPQEVFWNWLRYNCWYYCMNAYGS